MGKLIIALVVIGIILFAYRNHKKKQKWEAEFKDLRIEVMLNYHPVKFNDLKNKFDDLMNRSEQDSEAIHLLWRQFIEKYWREYSELILKSTK
jgi:hypothetical protein